MFFRANQSAVAFAVIAVAAVCWLLTAALAMSAGGDAARGDWTDATFSALFAMWAAMMAAMMLPSFAPTAAAYANLSARKQSASPGGAAMSVAAFVGGYCLAWAGFSAVAAVFQQQTAAALADALHLKSPAGRAALLFAAGAFQFSPLKFSCLRRCRHPVFFFLMRWKSGVSGALRMGAENGAWCLGCCALLMMLLFVGGVMDLLCIVLLALYVAAEKLSPLPPLLLARTAGAALLLIGALELSVYF